MRSRRSEVQKRLSVEVLLSLLSGAEPILQEKCSKLKCIERHSAKMLAEQKINLGPRRKNFQSVLTTGTFLSEKTAITERSATSKTNRRKSSTNSFHDSNLQERSEKCPTESPAIANIIHKLSKKGSSIAEDREQSPSADSNPKRYFSFNNHLFVKPLPSCTKPWIAIGKTDWSWVVTYHQLACFCKIRMT